MQLLNESSQENLYETIDFRRYSILGRHLVDAALDQDIEVTLFNAEA